MRIFENIYLVGSGDMGLSHRTDSHVYLVADPEGYVVVDAGGGVQPEAIIRNIKNDGLNPENVAVIVATHSHWDHARGGAFLKELTGARLAVHELGVRTLEETLWPGSFFARQGIPSKAAKVDIVLQEGCTVGIGNAMLEVMHTPGHTDDSVCLLLKNGSQKVLFTSDTVLADGCPGFFEAKTAARYAESVDRLSRLKVDVLLPGHKIFVLSDGYQHVDFLNEKISGMWYDAVRTPAPFYPGWWIKYSYPVK